MSADARQRAIVAFPVFEQGGFGLGVAYRDGGGDIAETGRGDRYRVAYKEPLLYTPGWIPDGTHTVGGVRNSR